MNAESQLLAAASILSMLVACRSPNGSNEPVAPEKPIATTVTVGGRNESVNAAPTGERGIYRVDVGMDRVAEVRVVPETGGGAESRRVETSHWSFDRSTARLRVDVPVDDSSETVIVLGTRARPPQITLPEGVDFGSVRVVVGDRLGIEGEDYTVDRQSGLLRIRGPDTPENPVRYYVQATLKADPDNPDMAQGIAFGNRGDMATVLRLLGIESP